MADLLFRRNLTSTVDLATDYQTNPDPDTWVGVGVILPIKDTKGPNEDFEVWALKQQRRRMLIVAGKDIEKEPMVGDQVFFENTWWSIRGFTPIAPDGRKRIIYKFWVDQ